MAKGAFFVIILFVFILGCAKTNTQGSFTCSYDYCGVQTPDSEVKEEVHLLDSLQLTSNFTKDCSGMFYHIVDTGTGPQATACNTVVVNYTGRFPNSATNFDSSTITYPLNQLITGWVHGVHMIKAGGHIQLLIPPALGYGYSDYSSIPARSYLFFDIKLLGVQ